MTWCRGQAAGSGGDQAILALRLVPGHVKLTPCDGPAYDATLQRLFFDAMASPPVPDAGQPQAAPDATAGPLAASAAPAHGESLTAVLVALVANALIAVAKSVAAAMSGSASMVAEAAHSWVDAGNEVFLLMAERSSRKPATALHPLGFGRGAWVWAMIAGFGLFTAGSVVSVMHGISAWRDAAHAGPPESATLAYTVLAVAFVLEAVSFFQVRKEIRAAAAALRQAPWHFMLNTSQTTLRSVYLEDLTALAGIVVAAAALWLHQRTGNALYDAAGSIIVGLLLGVVALVLIVRNAQFLIGDPGTPAQREAVAQALHQQPDVQQVVQVHLEFVGPGRVVVVATVDLKGDLNEAALAARLRAIEADLTRHPNVALAVLRPATAAAAPVHSDT